MALSRIKYPSSGVSSLFAVPFSYLSTAHVEVYLDGTQTTAFTWLSAGVIQLNTVPPGGVLVEIRRNTPKDARLVNFQDGSMLGEKDLDTDSDQLFFVSQETLDDTTDTLKGTPTGDLDATNRRIINLADAEAPQDAVNLRTLGVQYPAVLALSAYTTAIQAVANDLTNAGVSVQDLGSITAPLSGTPTGTGYIASVGAHMADVQAVSSNLASIQNASANAAQAQASQTAAAVSATNAATSEANALSSKNAASTSAAGATTSATNAATSEANALSSKNAASTSATNAATSEANALASKNAASTSATAASTSATNAATSEANASTSATSANTSAIAAAASAAAASAGLVDGSVTSAKLASTLDLGVLP